MKTWRLEHLICDAARLAKAVVAPVFAPPLTDWPRTDAYLAGRDGAEQLAEAEAEDDYLDPDDFLGHLDPDDFPIIRSGKRNIEDVLGQEPCLTDDELVAVRGLIQERYSSAPYLSADSPAGVDSFPPNPPTGPPTSELLTAAAAHLDHYLKKYEQSLTAQINGAAFIRKLQDRATDFKAIEDP